MQVQDNQEQEELVVVDKEQFKCSNQLHGGTGTANTGGGGGGAGNNNATHCSGGSRWIWYSNDKVQISIGKL